MLDRPTSPHARAATARGAAALWLGLAAMLATALALPTACQVDDPCDPGQVLESGYCVSAPSTTGGAGGAGGAGATGGTPTGGTSASDFGKPCEDTVDFSDCSGDAPICADTLFYCTNIDCQDGEANAGICPDGWSCIKIPDKPSACVDL